MGAVEIDHVKLTTAANKVQGLADIAFLLDQDGDGKSEFDVGDSVADVKELLAKTMAEAAPAAATTGNNGDFQDRYLTIMQKWSDDPDVATMFLEELEAATVDPQEYHLHHNGGNPSGALAYLLRDGDFGDTFLSSMGAELDEYERHQNKGAPGLWGESIPTTTEPRRVGCTTT